ncbi:MAG TPA: protoporphyrinogen oxidase [Bryobacteraceae bacterium]|jgi:oxygen-dependent protoporphyrinogen oxidase|nr:protoporphyrinogen oxidase [Bryobacteraceae bacterium]
MPQHVVIVGGGISGLSAAYDLARAGIPHTLFEKQARLGGVIETRTQDGCILECGPDSFLAAKPELLALIKELGLDGEIIGSNDFQRTTHILKHGVLVPLPEGVMMIVPTKVVPMVQSNLLGWGSKIRMGLELLRGPRTYPDRSVAEFVSDHFGQETLDYLAEPLLSGVYGGDPRDLSADSVLPRFVEMEKTKGSLGRAVMAAKRPPATPGNSLFKTLASGLGTVIETLATYANVRHENIETIERRGDGFQVRAGGEWIDASNVIVATPAHAASVLLKDADPELAKLLAAIPYSSSAIVSMIFDEKKFDGQRAGFGFLVPKRERDRLAACTFVGTKFPHRAPDDRILLRCFFGGTGDEAILNESDESLITIAREELRRILGLTAAPLYTTVSRWPKSMAQYNVGHRVRITEIKKRTDAIPGLHLAGNAYDGIGLPDCVRSGRQAAGKIPRL